MPGLSHPRAKAVPSDKSGAGAGVGAHSGRSGAQQQAAAVCCPALPWGCARTAVKTGKARLLPWANKESGVYCLKRSC